MATSYSEMRLHINKQKYFHSYSRIIFSCLQMLTFISYPTPRHAWQAAMVCRARNSTTAEPSAPATSSGGPSPPPPSSTSSWPLPSFLAPPPSPRGSWPPTAPPFSSSSSPACGQVCVVCPCLLLVPAWVHAGIVPWRLKDPCSLLGLVVNMCGCMSVYNCFRIEANGHTETHQAVIEGSLLPCNFRLSMSGCICFCFPRPAIRRHPRDVIVWASLLTSAGYMFD